MLARGWHTVSAKAMTDEPQALSSAKTMVLGTVDEEALMTNRKVQAQRCLLQKLSQVLFL